MSSISRDEVSRVAVLARIDLTPDQVDRFAADLDVIVDAIAQVSEVATADVPATSHPLPLTNVMRADEPVAPLTQDQALSGAPAQEGGRFLVPQILGEE